MSTGFSWCIHSVYELQMNERPSLAAKTCCSLPQRGQALCAVPGTGSNDSCERSSPLGRRFAVQVGHTMEKQLP